MGLGQETAFEFKHIPDLSKSTQREEVTESHTKRTGTERRNFQAFLVGCLLVSIMAVMSMKLTLKVIRWAAIGWV